MLNHSLAGRYFHAEIMLRAAALQRAGRIRAWFFAKENLGEAGSFSL